MNGDLCIFAEKFQRRPTDANMNLGVFLVALGACFTICSCFLNPHRFIMKYEENMAKAVSRSGKSNYNPDHDRVGGLEVSNRNTIKIRKDRSFGNSSFFL